MSDKVSIKWLPLIFCGVVAVALGFIIMKILGLLGQDYNSMNLFLISLCSSVISFLVLPRFVPFLR